MTRRTVTFLVAFVLAMFSLLAWSDCHGRRDVDMSVRGDDSTAAALRVLTHQALERAAHEKARGDAEQRRGDSLEVQARQRRGTTMQLAMTYDSARALVVIDSLPASAQAALLAADRFRISVVPAFAADSATIASRDSTIVDRDRQIGDLMGAIASLQRTDSTQQHEIATLKGKRAPRCGTKCGAVLGASLAALLHSFSVRL